MAAATKALKFGPAIKEVRLHLCQKSAASAGAREFVEKHYVPLKLANPKYYFPEKCRLHFKGRIPFFSEFEILLTDFHC